MESMTIGLVGLGKMGNALAQRLVQAGNIVYGFDPHATDIYKDIKKVSSLAEMATHTHIFWLMVPAGKPVDDVIAALLPSLNPNDIIIDGGNSFFKDSIRRAENLEKNNINFIDCGTSGGIHGQEHGFSLMIGGKQEIFEKLRPLFSAIAAPQGFDYFGSAGAGHYVKMVHNGVEYALLQAYGEGFHVLRSGHYKNLDLHAIARVWSHGAVVRSWLTELLQDTFAHDQELKNISGYIEENKTGRWTLQEAQKHNIPTPTIEKALEVREWSRKTGGNFATKVVAMLRNAFGGHNVKRNDEK
jgi:6-phosphogluconate dehydrogenase